MNSWGEIVTAWAAWVNKAGEPVQCRNPGTAWAEYIAVSNINRADFAEWRVKPRHRLARMLRTSTGDVVIVMKPWGAPCPETIAGEQWLGQWEEVPE
jgi:hypothetical protein